MGTKLDGKTLAANIRNDISEKIEKLKKENKKIPSLANIIIGEDGGSRFYFNTQNSVCEKVGIKTKSLELEENIQEETLIDLIKQLNEDKSVSGIILQLPLPKHLDENKIASTISIKKDVDGLNSLSSGKLFKGEDCFVPCTPKGIIKLIKSTGVEIQGKHAVVIGRSNIVGKPVAQLLLAENATVTMCHSKSDNLKEICKMADILVVAIGRPGIINKEYVKKNALVIDVGTTVVNGKLTGDVDYNDVVDIAAYTTPVPGGVGPMTTTMLLVNLCGDN
ncbi:bifunctional 5,10-methylenetetrahydrofolate dehydrogenase/5,10-methenyltetrahydrofolate cyclohydrolase [Clostridium grantii]|uniref:Bifunctional protein FolD n=1 Tax=Clostridium grantii DSM 8605 TaxID=1121316 RepID=A0A1M5SEX2_9CLOT|nr:tetrahydrofolate dehydrogenase/cyclohydrolase catalytic domain-containing protein [Clostridium grantii]SHH37104.1 methylenetetrahydrofolate dehydrogenase (NADP+) / methenyltetrahydrofolate cyclohydrolase [Clostridium grantii DSM 8605]